MFFNITRQSTRTLLVCWGFIKQHYADHHAHNRYGSITKLAMFLRKSGVIKMRGKAAELKGLCFPLLDLWKAHMNTNLSIHRKIKLMLQLNCQMETILDTYSDCYKLPMDVAKEFLKYFSTGKILPVVRKLKQLSASIFQLLERS